MNRLSRSTALKIAATLLVLLALFDLIVYELPALLSGAEAVDAAANAAGGPPYFMVLITSVMDIVAIVAAYGVWNAQRWGIVLGIITSVLMLIPALLGLLFAPDMSTRIGAAVGVILSIIVIILCLWREQRPANKIITA